MADFRYAQFCPLARAAELLGHRWSLLVVRELLGGPLRFGEIRERLHGISTSVLSARLAALEAGGLVERREPAPPASGHVYALTGHGEALRPILYALMRWGLRFLEAPRPGDRLEPAWVVAAAEVFAASGPTTERAFELRVRDERSEVRRRVAGGASGVRVAPEGGPVDAVVEAPPFVMLGLLTGQLPADAARAAGARLLGPPEVVAELPLLFDFPVEAPASLPAPPRSAPATQGDPS